MKKIKVQFLCLLILFLLFINNKYNYARWMYVDSEKAIMWLNDDMTYPRGNWYVIDEDQDGIGYYYYFDDIGRVLIDTIAPDYRIVDNMGRRTLLNGDPELVDMNKTVKNELSKDEASLLEFYNAAQKNTNTNIGGKISDGSISTLFVDEIMPTVEGATNNEGNVILGKNVVIKETVAAYDATIDRNCVEYIKSGSNYSKKVNGTTFTKVKWKGVIALKGTGAYFDVENPKNNFNRIRGKIATHYFTYSDRTTLCTLLVYDEADTEYFITSEFNYNSGATIDFTFPKKVNKLRFELIVDGQYPSRVAYIKDLSFYFNSAAYREEREEDLEESEWESMRRENGYNEIVEEENEEEEYDIDRDSDIEIVDDDDDDDKGNSSERSSNDSVSGPSFDKSLTATSSDTIAPDGSIDSPIWRSKK